MTDDVIPVSESPLYRQALAVIVSRASDLPVELVDQITELVQQLRDASDCSKYLQGGCLSKLYNEKLWRKRKPDMTFMEYVEDIVGIPYRKAMYLISIYDRATKLGCTAEQLDRVGWGKARSVLRIATKEDVEDWLARAETQTAQEVERDVRVAEARQRRPATVLDVTDAGVVDATPDPEPEPEVERIVEPLETFSVRLTVDQRKSLLLAIEKIAAENSSPGTLMSRGAALDLMATQYLSNALPREKSLEWACAQIARVYGVDLEVLPKAKQA
jgi:hypothetical protein